MTKGESYPISSTKAWLARSRIVAGSALISAELASRVLTYQEAFAASRPSPATSPTAISVLPPGPGATRKKSPETPCSAGR